MEICIKHRVVIKDHHNLLFMGGNKIQDLDMNKTSAVINMQH